MPVCWKCKKMDSSAEMRRTVKGHLCRNKLECRRRIQDAKSKG
jgi:hypothetical protein